MRKFMSILWSGLFLLVLGCEGTMEKAMKVTNLRCEYRVNPLGIDAAQPRLSWELESGQRGQKQSGYQILAAGSKELLAKNQGDLWDSGKVVSDQTAQLGYGGKPLASRDQCWWKVRVWDQDGRVSGWSHPAHWTMGLLEAGDWQANWIGNTAEAGAQWKKAVEPVDLTGCKWIWQSGEEVRKAAPGTCYFRGKITVPQDRTIQRARIRLSADDRYELYVNGKFAGITHMFGSIAGVMPVANYELTGLIGPGENVIAVQVANEGNENNPAGLLGRVMIEFASGEPAIFTMDAGWKSSRQAAEGWKQAGFDDSGWGQAQEIAALGEEPWGWVNQNDLQMAPSPYLRKEFTTAQKVQRAMVYVSALGCYELHLNGQRVGEDYFVPGWTDYNKRVYYRAYEVTDLMQKGANAIGAIVGDGWYAGHVGWGRKKNFYGERPWLKAQLELEYSDGSREMVATGGSWKAGYGALVESDMLMGESYDARLEPAGWDRAGYDDSQWSATAVKEEVAAPLQSYPGVTVQITGEVKAKEVKEPAPGKYVFDLGQNFAGWARLKVKGQAGDRVVLRFAEVLRPDGMIYTENLRGARCQDMYILKGGGEEVWQPHFTFHGFRYVEVTGYPGKPGLDAITGVVAHSATPPVGTFECSSPMVNQLFKNIVWGQRSNYLEVPTDCPQRDERLGWTGDAQIFIRTATYNMDVAAFFTKWLVDLDDAQNEEGAYPDVAPNATHKGAGVAAWGDAGVICPWTIYWVYGDTRVIEDHYDPMCRWIEYLKGHSENLLRPAEGYGDWVSIASDTPKDVVATAYFAYSTRLLSRMAAAIGKTEDAAKYERLFQDIRKAFNQAYVAEDGKIKGDTQTCYLLGLHFDLLPAAKRPLAVGHLIAALEQKNWHLSTGFVGLGYLLPTLSEVGRTDAAYRLLNNDTFPSWGYSIKNGATTIWERWDGWTDDKGFQDPGMNSFNHYSFGSVGQWMFATAAGIQTEGPGFQRLRIQPQPGGGMTYIKAGYDSIHGRIATDWRVDGKDFRLALTIPANTTATVYVPASKADWVTEGGRRAGQAVGVKFLRMEEGAAVYEVGSGDYHFISQKAFE